MNLQARHLPLCGLFLLLGAPALAAPRTLILSPRDMRAEIHSHAVVINLTSTYRALAGQLQFDPRTKACTIDVHFVVRSLTAPNALLRAQTMSRTFLDPVDFPETRYVGACQGSQLTGSLTLRGQTHPFDMALTFSGPLADPSAVHAEGVLNRYDWGLKGLHLALGREIRITNDISLDGKPPGPNDPGS